MYNTIVCSGAGTRVFCILGALKILYENNYDKWLIIEAEQDPKKANPFEYAKMGYKYLLKSLKNSKYEH